MLIRVTLFFESQINGWSESLHTSNVPGALLNAYVDGYILRRASLLPNSARISHARVSDDDNPQRDIQYDPPSIPVFGAKVGPIAGQWNALLVKLRGAPSASRNWFLRGLPLNVMDGQRYTPASNPVFNVALDDLLNYVRPPSPAATSSTIIRVKDLAQPRVPIFSANGITGVVTLTAVMPNVVPGDRVQLLGVPRSVVKDRFFRVVSWDPINRTLGLANWPTTATFGPAGFMRLLRFVGQPVTSAIPERITERRDGRPFGLLRGRSAPVR